MTTDTHTRGEWVPGLGWSCLDCDTFYCVAVNPPACGGMNTGCEQDGETEPRFGEMVATNMWIDHGPECPLWPKTPRDASQEQSSDTAAHATVGNAQAGDLK